MDPRHRRWQIFQEFPAGEQPISDPNVQVLHRRQIQQLLRTVREYLSVLVLDTCLTVGTLPKSVSVTLTFNENDHLLAPIFKSPGGVWQNLVGYLKKTAEFQMIPTLSDLQQKLFTPLNNHQKPQQLTPNEALDLLSILPCLPEWDTPGCWWRALKRRAERQPFPEAFPPDRDLALWREACYLARLCYGPPSPPTADSPRSHQLLGYPVTFEAFYKDPLVNYSSPLHYREADFYAAGRCLDPDTTDNRTRVNEGSLYRLWAFFIDAIQKQIEGNPEQTAPPTVNLLAYPLFSPTGWNFLHLYVRYAPGGDQPSLRRLWNDWHPVHEGLMEHSFRSFLVETLDRIELTYFQARLNSEIEKQCRGTSNLTDQDLATLLCKEAYTLFPARRLAVGAGTAYSGEEYYWPDKQDPYKVYVGWKWEQETGNMGDSNDAGQTVGLPGGAEVKIWMANDLPTREQPTLTAGRVTQHLEQQFQLARLSAQAIRRMTELTRSENRREWETRRYPQLVAQAHSVLSQLQHAANGRDKFGNVTFKLDNEEFKPEEYFRPYFLWKGLDSNGHDAWNEAYELVLTANGHLVISYFVETGVLHWLTHPTQLNQECATADIQRALQSSWSALEPILRLTPSASHVTCLTCIHAHATEILQMAGDGPNTTLRALADATLRRDGQQAPTCDACQKYAQGLYAQGLYAQGLPEWLRPPGNYQPAPIPHALADLQAMRERALRSPAIEHTDRLKSMFGLLQQDDTLFAITGSDGFAPTIHIALAGLPGWDNALQGLRNNEQLTTFFFKEPQLTLHDVHPADGFPRPNQFHRNYLAIFKSITEQQYAMLGTGNQVHCLQTFDSLLRGLGFVYCMKLRKQDSKVTERLCYLMGSPNWTDITTLVSQINPAVFNGQFENLSDGWWEAIVVVLDRVKV